MLAQGYDINKIFYSWMHSLHGEYFPVLIFISFDSSRGLQSEQEVLLTHGDSIDRVASSLKVIAKSGDIVAGNVKGHILLLLPFTP